MAIGSENNIMVKVLWGCLSGSAAIIIALVGSWAHEVSSHTAQLEARANVAEQHFVAIQHDIQDLRERMQELKDMLKEGR